MNVIKLYKMFVKIDNLGTTNFFEWKKRNRTKERKEKKTKKTKGHK